MGFLDNVYKGNILTGFAIGIGVVLIPKIIPVVANVIKPAAKAAVKGGLMLYEQGKEILATKKKTVPVSVGKKAGATEKLKSKSLTCRLKSVDIVSQTVMVSKRVKGKEEETAINVDDKTGITLNKKKKELLDLKAGDKLVIKYTEIEGKKVAKSLAIMPLQKMAQASKTIK